MEYIVYHICHVLNLSSNYHNRTCAFSACCFSGDSKILQNLSRPVRVLISEEEKWNVWKDY